MWISCLLNFAPSLHACILLYSNDCHTYLFPNETSAPIGKQFNILNLRHAPHLYLLNYVLYVTKKLYYLIVLRMIFSRQPSVLVPFQRSPCMFIHILRLFLFIVRDFTIKGLTWAVIFTKTSMTRTLMADLPWRIRTCFWVPKNFVR